MRIHQLIEGEEKDTLIGKVRDGWTGNCYPDDCAWWGRYAVMSAKVRMMPTDIVVRLEINAGSPGNVGAYVSLEIFDVDGVIGDAMGNLDDYNARQCIRPLWHHVIAQADPAEVFEQEMHGLEPPANHPDFGRAWNLIDDPEHLWKLFGNKDVRMEKPPNGFLIPGGEI